MLKCCLQSTHSVSSGYWFSLYVCPSLLLQIIFVAGKIAASNPSRKRFTVKIHALFPKDSESSWWGIPPRRVIFASRIECSPWSDPGTCCLWYYIVGAMSDRVTLTVAPESNDVKEGEWCRSVRQTEVTAALYRFCYCLVTESCATLCDLMDCNTPGFPVLHHLPELAQTHVHWVSDAIQSSVVPFSCLQSFQHRGLFQWVSSSHQVAKVLEFQLQHQSFHWIFRTDFL